jgi:TDG/mug DNA glycosylase family protein
MILPDLLKPNLNIVFCGTAAGEVSARKQAYYAGPGNQFYPVLHRIGLTPSLLDPDHYEELLNHKIGLTDMVKLTSGNDNVLRKRDYDVASFSKKIFLYQPKIVCFNGKKAAAEFWGKKTKEIDYGLMAGTIGETRMFCAPSTSGSARRYWNEDVWHELKLVLQAIKN